MNLLFVLVLSLFSTVQSHYTISGYVDVQTQTFIPAPSVALYCYLNENLWQGLQGLRIPGCKEAAIDVYNKVLALPDMLHLRTREDRIDFWLTQIDQILSQGYDDALRGGVFGRIYSNLEASVMDDRSLSNEAYLADQVALYHMVMQFVQWNEIAIMLGEHRWDLNYVKQNLLKTHIQSAGANDYYGRFGDKSGLSLPTDWHVPDYVFEYDREYQVVLCVTAWHDNWITVMQGAAGVDYKTVPLSWNHVSVSANITSWTRYTPTDAPEGWTNSCPSKTIAVSAKFKWLNTLVDTVSTILAGGLSIRDDLAGEAFSAWGLIQLKGKSTDDGTVPGGPGTPPVTPPTAPCVQGGRNFTEFSPYIDVLSASFNSDMLHEFSTQTVVKSLRFSSITNQGSSGCVAMWGGSKPIEDSMILGAIRHWTDMGFNATVVFGADSGYQLEKFCTQDQLVGEINRVLALTGTKFIEFDLSSKSSYSIAQDGRLLNAIKAVTMANPNILLTVTLGSNSPSQGLGPSLPNPSYPVKVLQEIKARNISQLHYVNIMSIEHSDGLDISDMYTSVIETSIQNLRAIWPCLSYRSARSMIGVTPIIGVQNNNELIYSQSDARSTGAIVRDEQLGKIGLLSYWNVMRDNGNCPPNSLRHRIMMRRRRNSLRFRFTADCSGISQTTYEFAQLLGNEPGVLSPGAQRCLEETHPNATCFGATRNFNSNASLVLGSQCVVTYSNGSTFAVTDENYLVFGIESDDGATKVGAATQCVNMSPVRVIVQQSACYIHDDAYLMSSDDVIIDDGGSGGGGGGGGTLPPIANLTTSYVLIKVHHFSATNTSQVFQLVP